jgi:hypothetical protein
MTVCLYGINNALNQNKSLSLHWNLIYKQLKNTIMTLPIRGIPVLGRRSRPEVLKRSEKG